jgi:2-hydroxychromene-2-carboxylate isomerase
MPVSVTCFSDPACPWGYSANPPLAVLRWRYGAQLDWRLVMIGLSEDPERYVRAGFTPARMALHYRAFRRYGMPFSTEPRRRAAATALACRAVIATRRLAPEHEWDAYRALQFAWFNTTLIPDEPHQIAEALERFLPEVDARAVVGALDEPVTHDLYQADRAESRTAAGTATEMQGKASTSDGPVRYTAPSLIFGVNGTSLQAGGFQPIEAYDVVVANLDPTLERRPPAEDPAEILAAFPLGLVTQEVAAIMAPNNTPADRDAAEDALIELAGEGRAERIALGDDALWRAAA